MKKFSLFFMFYMINSAMACYNTTECGLLPVSVVKTPEASVLFDRFNFTGETMPLDVLKLLSTWSPGFINQLANREFRDQCELMAAVETVLRHMARDLSDQTLKGADIRICARYALLAGYFPAIVRELMRQ